MHLLCRVTTLNLDTEKSEMKFIKIMLFTYDKNCTVMLTKVRVWQRVQLLHGCPHPTVPGLKKQLHFQFQVPAHATCAATVKSGC